MIRVTVDKEALQKFLAKIVWYTLAFIAVVAFMLLISSISAMIEAWSITKEPLIMSIVCMIVLEIIASFFRLVID